MVTRAGLKEDGTVVEVLRDGSERPLVPEVGWARVDGTTEAEIAAQQGKRPRRDRAGRCCASSTAPRKPPSPRSIAGARCRRMIPHFRHARTSIRALISNARPPTPPFGAVAGTAVAPVGRQSAARASGQ